MATYQAIPNGSAPARAIPDRGIPQSASAGGGGSHEPIGSSGASGELRVLKYMLHRLKALK